MFVSFALLVWRCRKLFQFSQISHRICQSFWIRFTVHHLPDLFAFISWYYELCTASHSRATHLSTRISQPMSDCCLIARLRESSAVMGVSLLQMILITLGSVCASSIQAFRFSLALFHNILASAAGHVTTCVEVSTIPHLGHYLCFQSFMHPLANAQHSDTIFGDKVASSSG